MSKSLSSTHQLFRLIDHLESDSLKFYSNNSMLTLLKIAKHVLVVLNEERSWGRPLARFWCFFFLNRSHSLSCAYVSDNLATSGFPANKDTFYLPTRGRLLGYTKLRQTQLVNSHGGSVDQTQRSNLLLWIKYHLNSEQNVKCWYIVSGDLQMQCLFNSHC